MTAAAAGSRAVSRDASGCISQNTGHARAGGAGRGGAAAGVATHEKTPAPRAATRALRPAFSRNAVACSSFSRRPVGTAEAEPKPA
jgi:hypothetical protein